jgi:peptidase inhibitor family I36
MARKRWIMLLATALAGVLLTTAAPAAAAPGPGGTPVRASYRGSQIDLGSGWHGAQSCVVFSRADVRCYASTAEADKLLGYSRATDPLVASAAVPAAVPACASGWLCLYADVGGQGRRLQFHDEYWNYLSNYSFDRSVSSWRNNQGSTDLGQLWLYNSSTDYTCAANYYVAAMGGFDNQAYAVHG